MKVLILKEQLYCLHNNSSVVLLEKRCGISMKFLNLQVCVPYKLYILLLYFHFDLILTVCYYILDFFHKATQL